MTLANILVSLFGVSGVAAIAAAYYYGVRAGKNAQADIDAGKVARRSAKMHDELLKERTAADVQKSMDDGTF